MEQMKSTKFGRARKRTTARENKKKNKKKNQPLLDELQNGASKQHKFSLRQSIQSQFLRF